MNDDVIIDDPETTKTEPKVPAVVDSMVGVLVRAELDTQIATAKANPRSITQARDNILSLATLDEQTAADNVFALPRGGKPIRGPSVRLAEIIYQQWGNCRVDARVIAIDRDNKVITAEGTFHDLETNAATRSEIRRRISDKHGRLYSEDMIVTTGNAACAIAKRNAVLAGVPKPIWRKAYEASERVIAGDVKTLATRREAAVKAFAVYGVKPEQIFTALEVKGMEDITLEHIPTLQGMFSAIKSGESNVEELFPTLPADKWRPPAKASPAAADTQGKQGAEGRDAGPPQDNFDLETGEVGPRAIERNKDELWRDWCARLLANIREETELKEVEAWLKANAKNLEALTKDAAPLKAKFDSAVGIHRDKIRPKSGDPREEPPPP